MREVVAHRRHGAVLKETRFFFAEVGEGHMETVCSDAGERIQHLQRFGLWVCRCLPSPARCSFFQEEDCSALALPFATACVADTGAACTLYAAENRLSGQILLDVAIGPSAERIPL